MSYEDLLYQPDHECPHGNGDNCECKLPRYHGLFAFRRRSAGSDKYVTVISYARQVHDGGMIEFFDPGHGNSVGCCGINKFVECAWPVHEYANRFPHREPYPTAVIIDDEGRYL